MIVCRWPLLRKRRGRKTGCGRGETSASGVVDGGGEENRRSGISVRSLADGEKRSVLEEGSAVERAAGVLFVLEVDINITILCESETACGQLRELRRSVTAAATHSEAGVGGGGTHLGGLKVLGLGDAEGGVALVQDRVDGVGKPAGMAELKGDGRGAGFVQRRAGEEVGEEREVELEVRRKLEEQQTELTGLADGLERMHELRNEGMTVAESLEGGDALRRFEGETKAGGDGSGA